APRNDGQQGVKQPGQTRIRALRTHKIRRANTTAGREVIQLFSRFRRFSKNGSPLWATRSSSLRVQSQSQQAHGSVPFSCRQFLRLCASLIFANSKNSSQYGRSSASGVAQKQVSTQ